MGNGCGAGVGVRFEQRSHLYSKDDDDNADDNNVAFFWWRRAQFQSCEERDGQARVKRVQQYQDQVQAWPGITGIGVGALWQQQLLLLLVAGRLMMGRREKKRS